MPRQVTDASCGPLARALAVLGLAVLALSPGCGRACEPAPREPAAHEEPTFPAPDVRLALLTDLMGQLEPCGCTSRPLGGLDLVAGALRAVRAEAPTLAFAAGHLHFGEARISDDRAAQARFEAETAERALAAAPFDAAFPAAPRGEIEREHRAAPAWLARLEEGTPRLFEAGGRRVLAIGVEEGGSDELARALEDAPERDVTLVLLVGSRRRAAEIAAVPGVDFVVLAGRDEEKITPPRARGGAHILTAGRQGQHLLVLDLYLGEGEHFADHSPMTARERIDELERAASELERKLGAWEREGSFDPADVAAQRARLEEMREEAEGFELDTQVEGRRAFVARALEIDPHTPRVEEVAAMLREHDKRVNAHNREALSDAAPIPVPEGEPRYLGSESCASCHAGAHSWWRKTPHGRAYRTLVERHKEYSLSCVGCHVTGYGEPGGATVTWNLDGALVDVGCEQCHGPGSAHVEAPPELKAETILRDTPVSICVGCHNEEHSDRFEFEAYRSRLIAPGHGK